MDEATSKKLKKLRRQRGQIQSAITKFQNKLESWKDKKELWDPDYLETALERIKEEYSKFADIQEQLEEIDETEESNHEPLVESYTVVVATARKFLRESAPPLKSSASVASENGQSVQILDVNSQPLTGRLPEIGVPYFNGEVEEWASFWDLFSSLVDKKPLSDTAKLQYLRYYLKGKAATLIQELLIIDSNYKVALDLLKRKYECPRRALRRHWAILREFPKLSRDTPAALGNLVDTFRQHLRALENLDAPVGHWDVPLIDLISSKIGSSTLWHWELSLTDNKMPAYSELLNFLEKRAALGDLALTQTSKPTTSSSHHSKQQSVKVNSHNVQTFNTNTPNKPFIKHCSFCSKPNHLIYQCDTFKALNVEARKQAVEQKSLCENCLRANHTQQNCKSLSTCSTCKQKHHSLLHVDAQRGTSTSAAKTGNSAVGYVVNSPTGDLITTASIYVLNNKGQPVSCRAMLDTCSNTHFMTLNLAKKLGLNVTECATEVGVLNSMSTNSNGIITTSIQSKYNNYQRELSFCAVENISDCVPSRPVERRAIAIPPNIKLADPEFHRPAEVEILIGSGTTLSLFCLGQITLSKDPELYLQKTLLGWVIGGSVPSHPPAKIQNFHVNIATPDFDLQKFWSVEEVSSSDNKFFTKEEELCEEHFKQNVSRDPDGRYVVALPFKENVDQLGKSKPMARKRLLSLEKNLKRNPEKLQNYGNIISEYITLGHMVPIAEGPEEEEGFYLPHHSVSKSSSLTTAVRIVFDGSAVSSSNLSLNQTLMVGPTIQSDLFSQLIRFRTHSIVISGDIEKMYRQFKVKPEHRKFQRILWRNEENQIQTYELQRVTFGLACASFLSIRCLHQIAIDNEEKFPEVSRILQNDFYVDNALFGTETVAEAVSLRDQLTTVLDSAGLNIYQWASNKPQVLQDLPPESVNKHLILGDSTVSTLGVRWNSANDSISYFVDLEAETAPTKRIILAQTAKIFDPLGLLAPVIITAKIIIQELWKLKLDWDESIPLSLSHTWQNYYRQLQNLNNLSFNRKIVIEQPVRIEIHGFCDAGPRAAGTCIYVRSINRENKILVTLLCAKSRVAPVKEISIPKLELVGAQLLANLMTTVKTHIRLQIDQFFYWTDSTIVLHWLHTYSGSLKVFVANRVGEIQTLTDVADWRHVRSHDNPADCITRGLMPRDFLKQAIFQNGPPFLSRPASEWPYSNFVYEPESVLEKKMIQCFLAVPLDDSLLKKFSSFSLLQNVVAYCLRWKARVQTKHLTIPELNNALKTIVRLVQKASFSEERHCLEKGKPLDSNSHLLQLSPFLDKEGLIRVGGRLKNSALPYSQRHPLLIPRSHHVTKLIIESEHHTHGHAGVQATLYAIRKRFWLPDGRNQVRKQLRSCIPCFKVKPLTAEYVMGDLPSDRITHARPFSRVSIDYCGYFFLKEKKFRNKGKVKAYVSVFVCLVTKAIHLELVTDLTSDSFIAALRRFVARRGLCTDIYTDNSTTFIGSDNFLKDLYEVLKTTEHQEAVETFAKNHGIQWHYAPARSPTFCGLHEAAVKSFKYHLKRVVGDTLFSYEAFNTFCVEIEAILNSRPLTPLSSDPNDNPVLTPGHFLIGESLTSLPDREFRDVPVNRLSLWQHLQQMRQHFWARWHKEYLNELITRSKWKTSHSNLQEGTLVLLVDDNLPPMHWALGRIAECHPGPDGVTRVVTVKTATSTFRRGVRLVAPLPI